MGSPSKQDTRQRVHQGGGSRAGALEPGSSLRLASKEDQNALDKSRTQIGMRSDVIGEKNQVDVNCEEKVVASGAKGMAQGPGGKRW